LNNNQTRIAKITEITTAEIKYKRWDNQEGPTFTEKKENVNTIKYKDGKIEKLNAQTDNSTSPTNSKVDLNKATPPSESLLKFEYIEGNKYSFNNQIIKENKMYRIMRQKNNPDLNLYIKKAKRSNGLKFIGFGAIPVAAFSLISFVNASIDSSGGVLAQPEQAARERLTGQILGIASVALLTTGVVFVIQHKKNRNKAVKLYNEKY
jgi:hypothetical protein